MAPTSRIILTRHAQAEHNVGLDYSIHDAPLTPLGKKQAATLSTALGPLQSEITLIASSPLKRTLQTTLLAYSPALARLGGPRSVLCLPEAQECNAHPCDAGSSRETLESDPEFSAFDFSRLTPDWNTKTGPWAAEPAAWAARAAVVRRTLRERPEEVIVLVAHGDILRWISGAKAAPSSYPWRNAEVREFRFEDQKGEDGEAWLVEAENVVVPGGEGYSRFATEKDLRTTGEGEKL